MTTPPPRAVPVSGLVVVGAVLAGLVLIVVGVWAELGWGWGLVAAGVGLVAVAVWPDGSRG